MFTVVPHDGVVVVVELAPEDTEYVFVPVSVYGSLLLVNNQHYEVASFHATYAQF